MNQKYFLLYDEFLLGLLGQEIPRPKTNWKLKDSSPMESLGEKDHEVPFVFNSLCSVIVFMGHPLHADICRWLQRTWPRRLRKLQLGCI